MCLQVAQTWFLLKHSWEMISVMNTSVLSTVPVLVLLQLVWSVFGAMQWVALCSASIVVQRWLQLHFGNLDKRVANTGAAVVCSGLPAVT